MTFLCQNYCYFSRSQLNILYKTLFLTKYYSILNHFYKGEYFPISISLEAPEILKGAAVSSDSRLDYLLKDYHPLLTQVLIKLIVFTSENLFCKFRCVFKGNFLLIQNS